MIPGRAIQFVSSNSFASMGVGVARTLRTEELSRDVQGLASHNNDLLAVEELLSHSAGQPTKEVTLAIDSDLYSQVTVSKAILPIPKSLCLIFEFSQLVTRSQS
jgi:hypothetical protein